MIESSQTIGETLQNEISLKIRLIVMMKFLG